MHFKKKKKKNQRKLSKSKRHNDLLVLVQVAQNWDYILDLFLIKFASYFYILERNTSVMTNLLVF
jgi:hypothetical protein